MSRPFEFNRPETLEQTIGFLEQLWWLHCDTRSALEAVRQELATVKRDRKSASDLEALRELRQTTG